METRALLSAAAETFTAPSLTDLIQSARQGQDTAPAAIHRILQAFQTQLDSGPLADLKAGTVNGSDFAMEVQILEASFEQNVDQQLSPEFPNVDAILKLEGRRIIAEITSLNQQDAVGLISSSNSATQAQAAIASLTGGPLDPLGVPLSAFVNRTKRLESDLNTLVQSLSTSASPTLTLAQVNTTLQDESNAYLADINSALQVTHPTIAGMVRSAVTTLEDQANTIAQGDGSGAQSQLSDAIKALDTALLDTSGVFGPNGVFSRVSSRNLGG